MVKSESISLTLPEKIRDTNATLEKNLSLDKNSKVRKAFENLAQEIVQRVG